MAEKLKILIVDDDRRMARTLSDVLKIKGYAAETAFSGPEALKKIKETSFDCVLSDVKMPGMNGVAFYKSIKKLYPHLPVVLMTAYSTDALVKEGLKEGVIASLTKPLDINLILGFLSSLCVYFSVIIIDDDPNFSETLSSILKERNFQISQTLDSQNITEKIKSNGQIILLNMKFKDTNVMKVFQGIRKTYPYLPIILISDYHEKASKIFEAALKINAYTFLHKPSQIEKLVQLLDKIYHQKLRKQLSQ